MNGAELWGRLAGGILPVVRRRPREVFAVDGAAYAIEVTWCRRIVQIRYSTPRVPADVRRAREADRVRGAEMVRRHLAGEPTVQVGDLIPKWATAFVERCEMVRDAEGTVWRRAEGDDRYAVEDDGTVDRSQEYDWIAFLAGEWGGGWCTNEGMLHNGPLTVLELAAREAA